MKKDKLAFIDLETTGTDPSKHEIIEIGCVLARQEGNNIEKVEEFEIKVKPERIEDAEQKALRINGYNEADWLFAVDLRQALETIAKKSEGHILAGQNIAFDWAFLDKAYRDAGLEWKIQYYMVDTKSIAFAKLHNDETIKNYSLRELCQHYGIENVKAHSALSDIQATFEVYKKLVL